MKSIGTIFIYLILASIIPISVGYYLYKVDDKSEKITLPSEIIFIQKNERKSITIKVRNLLVDMKFEELEKYLKQIDETYKKDITKEDLLFTVYDTFGIEDESYLKFFNTWLEAIPNSYNAYLARAIYYYHMGYHERGHKWISETKDEQIDKMYEYFKKSYHDLDKYFELNGESIVSYSILIRIHTKTGESDKIKQLVRKALKLNNNSYRIRARYLISITPRWGGSYAQMYRFLESSDLNIKAYPKLKVLYGYKDIDKAQVASISSRYNDANQFLKESLELSGEYDGILFELGKNNIRREKYKEAVIQLSKAIKLNPERSDFFYWRSKAYQNLENINNAIDDILYAYELTPYKENIKKRKLYLARVLNSQAYKLRKKYLANEAIEKYTLALQLDLNNDSIYYGIAKAYIQKHDLTTALTNIEIAIEIDPNNIDNYLLIDYILAKSKEWNQIILYWDKFIELNPKNDRAYVERGGAYYHKGNMKKAVENAKIAADLGSLEGQEAYDKFKHLVR